MALVSIIKFNQIAIAFTLHFIGRTCLYHQSENHGWTANQERTVQCCSNVSTLYQWQQPTGANSYSVETGAS